MASSRPMSSTRPRSDSITSVASMWEKLSDQPRRTKQDAPFANDEQDNDSADDDLPIENPNDNDTDSSTPPASSVPAASPNSHVEQQSKPWESISKQERLTIIVYQSVDPDNAIQRLKNELAKQGPRWTSEEQKLSTYHFGLTALHLHFRTPQSINIQMLCALPTSAPFWLTFNKPERQRIRTNNKSQQAIQRKFTNDFEVALQYGALTDLNQFRASPQHSWNSDGNASWAMNLHDEQCGGGCIEWFIESADARRKKQLLITNIRYCVVVDSREDGFDIYICQRCNLNEFKACAQETNNNKTNDDHQDNRRRRSSSRGRGPNTQPHRSDARLRAPPSFISAPRPSRQPQRIYYDYLRRVDAGAGCYFSTVRFRLYINRRHLANSTRHSFQSEIKQTLSLLIEYFLAHQITVCFAQIDSDIGPEPCLFFLPTLDYFPSLLMKYSWQLLSIVGYGLQLRINDDFIRRMKQLAAEKDNADELFYRVCVYLSRMFSLKPFVGIVAELEHAIHESKQKRNEATYGLVSKIDTRNQNEAYIPSVTLTPTTIRVKPLKLCRTNRVLRAYDRFGKPLYHFVLVDIRDENGRDIQAYHFGHLRQLLLTYLESGFALMADDRQYTYLHHSQSQLRCRQFWFYHHHEEADGFGNKGNVSVDDAYKWMGRFDHERNPAKYAARVALCFSTTRASVEVPKKKVEYLPSDIEIEINVNGKSKRLCFTDGCGTMSKKLRNDIKESLGIGSDFSAVQLRYGGCKGVVSLDTRLRDKDLCIRPSMKKFESDHCMFEVCKLSAPRPVFLNRQAILLLDNRHISHVSFQTLQQRNQLQLIRALLRNDDAQALLLGKIPQWFLPSDIHLACIDYIREPFFRQLLISACLHSIRDLLRRTRIRIPPDQGRNLMGIVDEYRVLKQDEVFIQYTSLEQSPGSGRRTCILDNCKVVITKNPCHHPGDIRTFTAVNYPELGHLKDVVVFSQQGDRPAPHDISGSDLDGDEYLVVWHPDLVPLETDNAPPYDYDAPIPPADLPRSVQRKDINNKVLEIAELDCLGRLSNLHLAFADMFGVNDNKPLENGVLSTVALAGAISQEVDSGKTGYHPLSENDIKKLNQALGNERPDYMDNANFDHYESKHILGRLYRASKRTLRGWNRLVRYHRHLRHLEVRTHHQSKEDENEEDGEDNDDADSEDGEAVAMPDPAFLTGVDRNHPSYHEITQIAENLASVYRQEMFEILNLYGLSHESDLWCRNSINGLTGELEDTAYTELEQLVQRTRTRFFNQQVVYCETNKCHIYTSVSDLCHTCRKRQQAMSVACYCECYGDRHASEQAPILSLPWLFAGSLLQHRISHQPPLSLPQGSLSSAMQTTLNTLLERRRFRLKGSLIKFKTAIEQFVGEAFVPVDVCVFVEILQQHMERRKHELWPKMLSRFVRQVPSFALLSDASETSDEWQLVLRSRQLNDHDDYLRALRLMEWNEKEDNLMHSYFERILEICFDEGKHRDNITYLNMSEDIILLMQEMAINEMIR